LFVKIVTEKEGMMDKYLERLPYQRNDYIAWIVRVKLEETKQK